MSKQRAHTTQLLDNKSQQAAFALEDNGPSAEQVIQRLRTDIASGQSWQHALLEAMAHWPLPYEDIEGIRYQYLLLGEAFDWITLAGRLLDEMDGLVSQDEKACLLFSRTPPEDRWENAFKERLGPAKYSAYLNYFYGVVVEEALLLAVEEEIRKERTSWGLQEGDDVTDLAYRRIYGDVQQVLVDAFFDDTGRVFTGSMTLLELKEFTYWLFKRRVNFSDGSRVASDTKKGMVRLQLMHGPRGELRNWGVPPHPRQ